MATLGRRFRRETHSRGDFDSLGIHWTRSTKYIVSIYRKADTARLDEFIGPKDRAVPWTNVHYTA